MGCACIISTCMISGVLLYCKYATTLNSASCTASVHLHEIMDNDYYSQYIANVTQVQPIHILALYFNALGDLHSIFNTRHVDY